MKDYFQLLLDYFCMHMVKEKHVVFVNPCGFVLTQGRDLQGRRDNQSDFLENY